MYLKYRINLWNKEELFALTKLWIFFTIPLYRLNEALFLRFRDLTTLTQIAWRRRRTSTEFPAKWETRHLVEREENGERKRRRDTSIRRERRDSIVVVHCTRIAFVIAPRGLSLSAFRFLSRLRATFGLVCESENDSDEVEWRSGLLVRLKRARDSILFAIRFRVICRWIAHNPFRTPFIVLSFASPPFDRSCPFLVRFWSRIVSCRRVVLGHAENLTRVYSSIR